MRSWLKHVFACVLLIATVGLSLDIINVHAASLLFVSDGMTQHTVGVAADHELVFTTPTGVNGPSDTIVVSLSGFTLSSIVAGDVALSHGPTTGSEIVEAVSGSAAAGVWGVSVAGTTLTLTPPTNAGAGEIASSDAVRIKVGLNAGGAHQIVNPSAAGGYVGIINGGFGDTGTFGLAIVANGQVLVTAEHQAQNQGGHGQQTDTVPPTIVNVVSTSTSPTSATIQWITNELSTSVVNYGLTNQYASGTVSDSGLVYQHLLNLTDLTPCTVYRYEVGSTDGSGNQSKSSGYSFKTVCDTTAPILSNIRAELITDRSATILWSTNEPATSRVEYGIGQNFEFFSEVAGYVSLHALPISGLSADTTYTYRVISTDVSGNTSVSDSYAFTTSHDLTPPTNVMLTATAGDELIVLRWTAPIESDAAGVRIVRRTDRYPTGPGDGDLVYAGTLTAITDASLQNGVTYYYGAYAYDVSGNYSSGALASATPEAGIVIPVIPPPVTPTSTPIIVPPPIVTPPPVIPGGSTSTPPVIPGTSTPDATARFEFFGANGMLPLVSGMSGVIGARANSGITVRVPLDSLNGTPRYVVIIVGEFIVQLELNREQRVYEGTFSISPNSNVSVRGQVLYTDGRVAEQKFFFRGYSSGYVTQSPLFGTGRIPVPGAEIRLYREELGAWVLWNGSLFGESNPQLTSENGSYVFEVPTGRYYAEAKKEGYEPFKTEPILVTSNVFNEPIELIYIPKSLRELFSSATTTSFFGTTLIVAKSIAEHVAYELQKLRSWLNTPEVQQINTNVVTPIAVSFNALNTLFTSWFSRVLSKFRFLFLQPGLLFLFNRRKKYGVVYNSYTKRPIEGASIRLMHADTGIVLQTAVTDQYGRFVFHAIPGTFRLEVYKQEYEFPSNSLKDIQGDGSYREIYTGGNILVSEGEILAPDIPLDPLKREEKVKRMLMDTFLRRLRYVAAFSTVIISFIAFLITPTLEMAFIAILQAALLGLFWKITLPHRPKTLQMVVDAETGGSINHAIIKLYDGTREHLLETQVTGQNGRYGFLVGPNVYSITAEANGYKSTTMDRVDLTKKKDESYLSMPIALKKLPPKGPLMN